MKISTCTNKHFLRKIEVFIRFDRFLMYIDIHTKSQNFLKISMFSNKKFTLTIRAQLFEKVNISHKISILFPKKLTVLNKKLMLRKTLVTLPQSFARLDFITVLKNSLIWPKTNTFCIKWHFLPKGNNATKNWHFSKTENTSLRKLTMSTRNYNFWKQWPFARKMKISFNIDVSARFRFYQWNTHNATSDTKPIVILFKTDN